MRSPKIPVGVTSGTLRLGNDDEIAMARTLVTFANKSSADTGRRVARAARTRAEKGKFNGGVRRFGRGVRTGETRVKRVRDRETGDVRNVEVDVLDMNAICEDEAAQIRKAVDDLLNGVSFAQVFAALKASGVKPVMAAQWSEKSFRQTLISPHVAGLAVYNGTSSDLPGGAQEPNTERLYPAEWSAIVPEEKWRAVRRLLSAPERRTSPGNTPKWLGSLIYLCGACEEEQRRDGVKDVKPATLVVGKSGKGRHPAYVCRESRHLARVAKPLDDFVEKVVIERLSRADAVDLLRADTSDKVDTAALHEESLLLGRRKDEAAALFASGAIDAAQLTVISGDAQRRLGEIDRLLSRVAQRDPLADIAGRPDAKEVWDSRDVGQQRAILRELVTVTVLPAKAGRPPGLKPGEPYFDPRKVRIEPRREPKP
jgi:hypothetical protein